MILQDIKELKTGQRELRKFGLMVGGVFAVLGVLMLIRHRAHYSYFLVPGAVLMVLGSVLPQALKQVYVAWMAMAMVIGFIVSNIILTLFFFLVITPVGLLARCVGKDFLRLKLDRQAPTYWIRRERRAKSPAEYERQF